MKSIMYKLYLFYFDCTESSYELIYILSKAPTLAFCGPCWWKKLDTWRKPQTFDGDPLPSYILPLGIKPEAIEVRNEHTKHRAKTLLGKTQQVHLLSLTSIIVGYMGSTELY